MIFDKKQNRSLFMFMLIVITLYFFPVNTQSTFAAFKSEMQMHVKSISDQMSLVYANRCSSTFLSCQTKSYNYCLGTAYQECINNFPTPGGCIGGGANLALTSAVRFPNTTDANTLTAQQRHFVCTSAELQSVFRNLSNINSGRFTFTYFGTQLGSFRNFPVNTQQKDENGNCKNYDPRFRPWYVTGSSSGKNVILIIDISGSMSNNNRMTTAIAAAKAVINTLSNNDFVGVIKFSSSANSLVNGQIKRATTQYKEQLVTAIDQLIPQGSTNYEAAFNLGFDMLSQASADLFGPPCPNAQNIFLFLTDGAPTVGATTQAALQIAINARNTPYNIKMFTYGMDADLATVNSTLLVNLACIYNGIYFAVPSTASSSQLLTVMRSYYTYIAEGVTIAQAQWTQPYEDAFGFGKVVTVSFPAYYTENGVRKILGVAGLDVLVDYVSRTYQLSSQELEKQLLNNAVCYASTLTACQIEYLRPTSAKCGTACPVVNTQNICNSVSSNIYVTPVSTDDSMCCGITVGGLIGIIIGLTLAAVGIAIVIYCIVRQVKKRAAQQVQIQQANMAQGKNNIIIQHRYGQVPPPGYLNNSMGDEPQWIGPSY